MLINKSKCVQILTSLLIIFNASIALSTPNSPFLLKQGHAIIQFGGYWSNQGKSQHINIQDLIGDQFTVANHHGSNGLVGLGYFLDSQEKSFFKMSYGINAFYLPKTDIMGNVIQEDLFTNLSYQYNLTHYPVYAIAKSIINTKYPKYMLTVDVGVGPNFMRTDGFHENSLDEGRTIPDYIFSGHTSTVLSATTGFNVRINHVFGSAPLECGYRFFYLGKGHLNAVTELVLNSLNTGSVYGHAMICSLIV